MPVDICLTGSHGLIGTALIRSLRADGHRVLRLVRGDPEGADDVRWDPDAGTIDAVGLEGVDAVPLASLVSRVIPLESLQEGMETALGGGPVMKVLVNVTV